MGLRQFARHKRILFAWILLGSALIAGYTNCGEFAPYGSNELGSIGGSNNSGGPGGGGGGNSSEGALFFKNNVVPAYEGKCTVCHNEPRFGGIAPLTIFEYTQMKPKLTAENALSSAMLRTVMGVTTHSGGNQCPNGLSDSPCKEIAEWFDVEFKPDTGGGGGNLIDGQIVDISAVGEVLGYARDQANPDVPIVVHIYVDGPVGEGTLLDTVTADLAGPGGTYFGHYFTYQLPANVNDGTERELFVYGIEAQPANQIPARKFAAYTPTQAGRDHYTSNVLPRMNQCLGCHSPSYEMHYLSLLNLSPFEGGTALNNEMINKPSGNNHGGGNLCGNKNSGVCAEIQEWWQIEFGN